MADLERRTRPVPVAPGDWTGPPHERPGLLLRRWQVADQVAEDALLCRQPPCVHGPRLPEWSDEMPSSARELVAGLTGWLWVPTLARGFAERGASTSRSAGYRPRRWTDVESAAVRLRHLPARTGAVAMWLRDVGDDVDPPTSWGSPQAWIWTLGADSNGRDRPVQVPVAVGVTRLRAWLMRIEQEFSGE